jgi:hypothetical protein
MMMCNSKASELIGIGSDEILGKDADDSDGIYT